MNKNKKLIFWLCSLSFSLSLTSCLNPFHTYPILRPDQYRNDVMFVNTIGRNKNATLVINETMYYFSARSLAQVPNKIVFTLTSDDTEGIFPKNIDHWYANWSLQKDDETGVEQLVVRVVDDFISYYVGGTLILNRVTE